MMEQQGISHNLRMFAGWVPQKYDGLGSPMLYLYTTINNVIVYM